MVRLHHGVVVTLGPHQAADPPVGRVQGVGVVAPEGLQAGPFQPLQQGRPPVDADVAPGDVVVLVGQGPFDHLGPVAGHGDGHRPPGRRTRDSSAMAPVSSGMCSRTSEAITRSKLPSPKGSRRALPWTAPASSSFSTSPASTMAPMVLRTWVTSSLAASQATTRAPSRTAWKA